MAEWYEWLTNPVGSAVDNIFGLRDEDIGPAESSYVRPINPLAGAQEAEAQRLQAIAEGRADDPSVTGMQQALDRAGGQAYGLGRSSGLQSAAARGRLARGGQLAVERDAPELIEAQRLQTQQAAQAGLLGIRQDQRGIEQARLEDEKNRALRGEIRPIMEMEAKRSGIKGAIGEAGATLLSSFSDERLKENVEPGQPQTREFLEALSPKSFDYKGAQPQEPQRLGVMAQDLQQSQQGQQMVSPQPAYGGALAIDPTQATGPMLAALGDLNERMNQVEGHPQTEFQRPPEPQLPPPPPPPPPPAPTYAQDPHALRSPDAPPPGMTTALAASAHAPRPLASSQMESAQIGAIMKKTAEEEVLGKFGGNMQAYDAWHRALPAAQRAQIRNWGDAKALLEKGPIASPEVAAMAGAEEESGAVDWLKGLFGFGGPSKEPGAGQYASYKPPPTTGRKDMVGVIDAVARAEGVDPGDLVAMGLVESNLAPSATPPEGSAKGLFQFVDDTWDRTMKLYGKDLGIPANTPSTDPVASTMMAVALMRHNDKALKGKPGVPKEMGPPDYYAGHFLGENDAKKFYKKMEENPNHIAKDILRAAAGYNPDIFYHGKAVKDSSGKLVPTGRAKTLKEVYAYFKERTAEMKIEASRLLKSKGKEA